MRLAAAPAQQETEDEAETKGDKRRDERPLLDLVAHALRLPSHFGPSGFRRTARFLPGVGEAMSSKVSRGLEKLAEIGVRAYTIARSAINSPISTIQERAESPAECTRWICLASSAEAPSATLACIV